MRRVALLLAALALAGCASPGGPGGDMGGPPGFRSECPPPQASARWTQPGLYEAFSEAVAQRPDIVSRDHHEELLPLHAPDVLPWDEPHFLMLQRVHDSWWISVQSWRPGEVRIEMPYHEDEVALERLRAMLGELGLAGSPEQPAWERALLATRGQGPYLHTTLVGDPDVDGLIARLGPDARVDLGTGPGDVVLEWDGWRLRVRIPTHALDLADGAGALRLSVDVEDRASMWGDIAADVPPFDAFQARANERFAALGVPAPTFTEISGGSGRCGYGG